MVQKFQSRNSERIVRLFCIAIESSKVAQITKLSQPRINKIFDAIRQRIREDNIMIKAYHFNSIQFANQKNKKTIRLAAMNLLARREYSFYELTEKLIAKQWEKTLIHEVLLQLKTEGLQSDQRFTENYIRFKANRGSGPVKIAYELVNKGIDKMIIQQHMEAYQDLWPNIIKKVIATKTRHTDTESLNATQKLKEQHKMQRFLQQRGFPISLIHQVLKIID